MMKNHAMGMQCSLLVLLIVLAGCAREPIGMPDARPVVLAGPHDGVSRPYGVAVDATRVYWTERGNGGSIRAVAKAGGPIQTLARGTSPYAWFCAVDGRHVYWTEYDAGTLRRVPKAGGEPERWEGGLANPGQLVVRGGWVYWVEYSGNVIRRRRTSGGRPALRPVVAGHRAETFAAGLAGPQAIAVDDEAVYWTECSDPPVLRRKRLAGGAATTLATVLPECWLVLTGDWLWWTETRGFVRRIPRRGGVVQNLAPIPPSGAFAAASSTHVYWAEEHGHVMKRMALTGGTVETVLTGMKHPTVMAADDLAVYWADPALNAILSLKK